MASQFIFNTVQIQDISNEIITDFLISPDNLTSIKRNEKCDLLILKTNYCYKRYTEEYWNYNWGLSPECANYLKEKLPNLQCILFDTISLTSFQNRPKGRVAHKEFLIENNLLIVEDVDLREINSQTNLNQIIIAPLRFENCDGTPVTILAHEI